MFSNQIAARRLIALLARANRTMVGNMDGNILPIALGAFTVLYIAGWVLIERWREAGRA
jgi:hypothetical protein